MIPVNILLWVVVAAVFLATIHYGIHFGALISQKVSVLVGYVSRHINLG